MSACFFLALNQAQSVIRSAQNSHEDLSLAHVARLRMDDRHRLPGIVHEQLLPALMELAQGAALPGSPVLVALAELAIAVAGLPMALAVLLPEQPAGHALGFELLMKLGKVGDRIINGIFYKTAK